MNMKRIICALLSLVMAVGVFAPAAFAAEEEEEVVGYAAKVDKDGKPLIDYLTKVYATPEEKLADMRLVREKAGHQIWYEDFTGEVAYVDLASGEILFTNPWDVAAPYNKASDSTKQKLLSQLVISYVDNGMTKEMSSYTEAAVRGQIVLKNIKDGIRVEYTIGEEKVSRLVPRLITKERFEEMILNQIEDRYSRGRLNSFYTEKNPEDPKHNDAAIAQMYADYPITKTDAIYVCSADINQRELKQLEEIIKTHCPNYTYEEMAADHDYTGYTGKDADPPMFKMAIEYRITDEGDLEARLPASGIRFDESVYKMNSILFLPYFGTGSNEYTGYTFVPDGSGTLVRFEDVKKSGYNITGQLYGADYAYHSISAQHTEVMRWPVFGTVTNYPDADRGFFAIITEGDSLTTMRGEYGGNLHSFNTVFAEFKPRPTDQYNLAASISVANNAMWSVESDRKYTGSYRILYKMLVDDEVAEEKGLENTYDASYMGMVDAYRTYLTDKGALTTLTDTTENIPLYIESFGSMVTTEKVLSFPVDVDTPLTTFEDVKAMYDELTALGVGRLNFRLNGFHNGGIFPTVPYKLKWMDVLGGNEGFSDLMSYASEQGFGIFPDFDFVYVTGQETGDGMNLRKYAVKTIDDRYTSKRYYDAATQSFTSDFSLCISASAFEHFYDKFTGRYQEYNPTAISVATLGSDLNSDFDEDEPYNREESKEFTMEILQKINADYNQVMIDGGNAYTLAYANHIMNISTDSSNFLKASEAIPFMGMVLHGSKYLAGTPINMEGDINSAVLKAIENGSSLYFTLSKQNTSRLKDYWDTSKYYSVSYDIWKEELVQHYTVLNEAIGDLQTSLIVDHEFLYGERVPDADELAADQAAAEAAAKAEAEAEALAKEKEERAQKYEEMTGRPYVAPATDTPALGEDPMAGETPVVDEPAVEDAPAYEFTKYTTTKGSIVRVEYEGDVSFLLNYNSFDVTVEYNGQNYTIEALGFVRID